MQVELFRKYPVGRNYSARHNLRSPALRLNKSNLAAILRIFLSDEGGTQTVRYEKAVLPDPRGVFSGRLLRQENRNFPGAARMNEGDTSVYNADYYRLTKILNFSKSDSPEPDGYMESTYDGAGNLIL